MTETSERDREMARAYLYDITGTQNPVNHVAQWFAAARAEGAAAERERIAVLMDKWDYPGFAIRIRSGQ